MAEKKKPKPPPVDPDTSSLTDKSVDTGPKGYADIKGSNAPKPGESKHDNKRAPAKG